MLIFGSSASLVTAGGFREQALIIGLAYGGISTQAVSEVGECSPSAEKIRAANHLIWDISLIPATWRPEGDFSGLGDSRALIPHFDRFVWFVPA